MTLVFFSPHHVGEQASHLSCKVQHVCWLDALKQCTGGSKVAQVSILAAGKVEVLSSARCHFLYSFADQACATCDQNSNCLSHFVFRSGKAARCRVGH